MERWGETILGAIVAAVAIGFFAFAAAQAGQGASDGGAFTYTARFQRVDGIAVGSDVRVSGVKVGVVRDVGLTSDDSYFAQLTLAIDRAVPDETTARITSDGLLGGAYVSLEPAGMDMLATGGEILNTQGSVDLLTLFASFAQGNNNQNQSQNETTAP